MSYSYALYISLAIFAAGLVYKISNWFRYKISPYTGTSSTLRRVLTAAKGILFTLFSAKILILLRVFIQDVLWQKWLLEKDFLRWFAHICIYGGFMLLLLMHGLDELITSVIFADYYSTLNPFIFLRNCFGLVIILGLGIAIYRRCFSRAFRPRTTAVDYYAILILAVIMISGMLLEGTKILSHSKYEEMVQEYSDLDEEETEQLRALGAYWVQEFGMASPHLKGPFDKSTLQQGEELHEMSCAGCHSRPQWAFVSYGVSRVLRPMASPLDRANVHTLLWYLHFLACFAGLAYLPFSKFFHILATPVYRLVNAVIEEGKSDPSNVATKQAMELDACTHCGDCTSRCSVAVAFNEIPNPDILPSEKLAAFRALLSGKRLSKKTLKRIQEASYICTDCHRCTDICPVGINLEDLWLNLKSHLASLGYPKPEAWAKEAIGADFVLTKLRNGVLSLSVVDEAFMDEMGRVDASTFSSCFGCQNCTNVCPVVGSHESPRKALGLLPHEIMHCLALKQKELALGSMMLWDCLTCYICQEQCPQGVCVTDVLYQLKNFALKQLKLEAR
ncbi:MAG: 4Fe-4S dicluster domain-containing protein [Desulfobacteraceae bacterium]|nr:MAG: 4Fe-4S dicluster domain-containing protein [Desulfobacteraceae bacterium]